MSRQNNNVSETESWLDVSEGDVSSESTKIVFPSLYWMNGERNAKAVGGPTYTGGFFLPADSGIVPNENSTFVPFTRIPKDGDDIPGYIATRITATIIRKRVSILAAESDDRMRRFPVGRGAWDVAEKHSAKIGKKPRSHAEILMHVDGLPALVTLSLKGMATMGLNDRNEWLQTAMRRILDPANRFARERVNARHTAAMISARKEGKTPPVAPATVNLPLLRFRFTIGVAMVDDTTPLFVKVGEGKDTSIITKIALIDPAVPLMSAIEVSKYALPETAFRAFESDYRAAEPWVSEWSVDALNARNVLAGPGPNGSGERVPTYSGDSAGPGVAEDTATDETDNEIPF